MSTPLMQQYSGLKDKYKDCILMFRLGDFYEIFGEEARAVAPVLEIVLTARLGVPMCGVPHHAVNSYVARLIKSGYKVAVAEQMEEPSAAKGIVRREVVRVITPGTILEEEMLDAKTNNYLAGIVFSGDAQRAQVWALASVDISTGAFNVCEVNDDGDLNILKSELCRIKPAEIVMPEAAAKPLAGNTFGAVVVREDSGSYYGKTGFGEDVFTSIFGVASSRSFGLEPDSLAVSCIRFIINYINNTQPEAVKLIKKLKVYNPGDYLFLDANAIRHLDVLSLLKVLDKTVTAMGARKLRAWTIKPLTNLKEIHNRLSCVDEFVENTAMRTGVREYLKCISDVERLLGKITVGKAGGRDFLALKNSAFAILDLHALLCKSVENSLGESSLAVFTVPSAGLMMPQHIIELLDRAISEEPPARAGELGIIKRGYSSELDGLNTAIAGGKAWIASMEATERQRTGINSLKVGYNDVFGYYLEVSKPNLSRVPKEWLRKQTLANAERFITPELKEKEEKILNATQKAKALEQSLLEDLRRVVLKCSGDIQNSGDKVARIDVFAALAECALERDYVRPELDDSSIISIEGGRHPVMETMLPAGRFIPNDTLLDDGQCQIMLITGPNMSGKSTYLRQTGLITIMAQLGSYVPAKHAKIGIRDRIFTRIGADDRILEGSSTFMVEMQEVSTILNSVSGRSLIIMDEVGRGTSTYDGISIAWSVVEHIAGFLPGPKVVFATHYFELTGMANTICGIRNFHAAVREWSKPDGVKELVFLHQIMSGPADRSYGIHVAEMAGLPEGCIIRARQIMDALEKKGRFVDTEKNQKKDVLQSELF